VGAGGAELDGDVQRLLGAWRSRAAAQLHRWKETARARMCRGTRWGGDGDGVEEELSDRDDIKQKAFAGRL
jgi:hypothetical protein